MSPHLQVQGGIKNDLPRDLSPSSSLSSPGRIVTPLPSIKPHPHVLLGFFHLEHKGQDLLRTMNADNICGEPARRL
jgi:hypothetical protein